MFYGKRDASAASRRTIVQAHHQSAMIEDHGGTSSAGHGVDEDDFFTLDEFVEDADGHGDGGGDRFG